MLLAEIEVAFPKLYRTWLAASEPRLNEVNIEIQVVAIDVDDLKPVGVTPFALVMLMPVIVAPLAMFRSMTFSPFLDSAMLIVPPVEFTFVAPLSAVRLVEALVMSVELPKTSSGAVGVVGAPLVLAAVQ